MTKPESLRRNVTAKKVTTHVHHYRRFKNVPANFFKRSGKKSYKRHELLGESKDKMKKKGKLEVDNVNRPVKILH